MTGEDQTGKITEQLKQRMTRDQKEDSICGRKGGLESSRARAKSLTWVPIHVCTHFAVLS
jgi:hypothetical protein